MLLEWLRTTDRAIFIWFNGLPHPEALNLAALVVHLLTLTGILFLLFAWWISRQRDQAHKQIGTLALVSWLVGFLCTFFILKPLFSRSRPIIKLDNVHVIGQIPDSNSFPSGQVATAAAFAVPLLYYKAKRKFILAGIISIVVTGADRIYMGHHYPLDVAGGVAAGLVSGLLVCRWNETHAAKKVRK